jgi:phage tail sheath protein FI
MVDYQAPGVYRQDVFPPPPPSLLTGVPVFLGYADQEPVGEPVDLPERPTNVPLRLTLWPQFEALIGRPTADGYLADAVRGFFQNSGVLCYVVRLEDGGSPLQELQAGLAALDGLDAVDLVCAPDIMRGTSPTDAKGMAAVIALQAEVLADCRRAGGRFAILDALLTSDTSTVEEQRAALAGEDGALYHPWLWVPGRDGPPRYVPPCGHLAGAYARSDQRAGAHKAPANEAVEGVLDLRDNLTEDAVGRLYAQGVNCLRALPGRGIRVWGARTLSDDPAWRHVGARRVFLTMGRWVERFMTGLVHEPNDVRLWVRIMRELTAYLDGLFERGALKGRSPDEAFFVKCDGETNPPEVVDAGVVVTLVGLALAAPAEFVVARIIHGASGVSIQPGSAIA